MAGHQARLARLRLRLGHPGEDELSLARQTWLQPEGWLEYELTLTVISGHLGDGGVLTSTRIAGLDDLELLPHGLLHAHARLGLDPLALADWHTATSRHVETRLTYRGRSQGRQLAWAGHLDWDSSSQHLVLLQ